MSSLIDFWDLEHGLEVLADRIEARDRACSPAAIADIQNCLDLAWRACADARGSAADDFRALLFALYAEDASLADVARLRAGLARMGIDYANAHESTVHKRHRAAVQAGSKGGKAPRLHKQIERELWEQEMRKMLARNRHRSPADMARAIADLPDVEAKPDTIARHLRRVLKGA